MAVCMSITMYVMNCIALRKESINREMRDLRTKLVRFLFFRIVAVGCMLSTLTLQR